MDWYTAFVAILGGSALAMAIANPAESSWLPGLLVGVTFFVEILWLDVRLWR